MNTSKTEAANRNQQTLYSDRNTMVLYADVAEGGRRHLMFAVESIGVDYHKQDYVLQMGPDQTGIRGMSGIAISVGEQKEHGKFNVHGDALLEGGEHLRCGDYHTASTDYPAYERVYSDALKSAKNPTETFWNLVDALRRDFIRSMQSPYTYGFRHETSKALNLLEDMAVVARSAVEETRKVQRNNSVPLRKEV
jgi:hypothetical protein